MHNAWAPLLFIHSKERESVSAENHDVWVSLGLEDYEESYDKIVAARNETNNRDDLDKFSILLTENAVLRGERDFWKAAALELLKHIMS